MLLKQRTQIYYAISMENILEELFCKLSHAVEDHESKGSGLDEVDSVKLVVNKFKALKASSHLDLLQDIAGILVLSTLTT
jgi:hypothetical protein